jgi:hypothetical protein
VTTLSYTSSNKEDGRNISHIPIKPVAGGGRDFEEVEAASYSPVEGAVTRLQSAALLLLFDNPPLLRDTAPALEGLNFRIRQIR